MATDLQGLLNKLYDEENRALRTSGSGTIRVEDEGVSTVAAATALNFAGAGVTVTDAGSNEALVTIPGGGAGTVNLATIHAFGG